MSLSTNPANSQGPYIRTSRHFPQDLQPLAVELNRSYVDIANHINQRTIGIFATQRGIVTGESWYLAGQNKQQTLRLVFQFTAAGNIPHGLKLAQIVDFTRIYGTFTDGSVWYPLPYVDVVSATNQVSVVVNATNIVIASGAGSPPTITSGLVILEWLSPV